MTAIADAHQAIAALGWSRLAGRDFPPPNKSSLRAPPIVREASTPRGMDQERNADGPGDSLYREMRNFIVLPQIRKFPLKITQNFTWNPPP